MGIVLLMVATTDVPNRLKGSIMSIADGLRDNAVLPPAGEYYWFSGGVASSPTWNRFEFQPFHLTWEHEVSSPQLCSIVEPD